MKQLKQYCKGGFTGRLAKVFTVFSVLLFSVSVSAQQRLETPIRLKIEGGNTDQVSVVLKNLTTGETNSVNGESKFSLSLKLNCDYIISFNKPGYVSKKIQVNTTIPADRALQGLYPFPFDVYLFKQYDGVNIVVFNQPVGKISYSTAMDEFDYDTDYTKQIQSLIKEAEEQTRQMALVEQEKAKELEKEQVALKKIADQEAKEAAKLKEAEEKRALAELKAAEEEKKQAEKLAYQEKQKELKAQAEADKKSRLAALEAEEQKRKLAADAAEDSKPSPVGNGDAEAPVARSVQSTAEEVPPQGNGSSGEESLAVVSQAVSDEDPTPPGGYMGSGHDQGVFMRAPGKEFQDSSPEKARASIFQEQAYAAAGSNSKSASFTAMATAADIQPLPEKMVEEITEMNRVITRVTIKSTHNAVVYRRVVYRWGGVYFFKNDRPISESLFISATASR